MCAYAHTFNSCLSSLNLILFEFGFQSFSYLYPNSRQNVVFSSLSNHLNSLHSINSKSSEKSQADVSLDH